MDSRPWHRHYDPWVPTTIRYPQVSVQDFLHFAAKNSPDRDAMDFYGTRMTFDQVRLLSLRLANALQALGVTKGDRVALHLPNCPQYVLAYYATLFVGAIVVNVNPLYTVPELRHAAEMTEPKAWITSDLTLPNVRTLVQSVEIPAVVATRVTDFIEGVPRSTAEDLDLERGWHHFSNLVEGCTSDKRPRLEISQDDPAVIVFTGGTTGTPKGAVLTHGNFCAANFGLAAWGGHISPLTVPPARIIVAIMPFFHVYGQICCLNWIMMHSAMMILVPRFELEELIGILAKHQEISWLPAVPTLLNAIVNHPKAEDLNLAGRIRLVNTGAAPMPRDLIDRVQDMGIMYTEGWGMTETTAMGTSNPLMGMKKFGSIGIPQPDVDVRLVDTENGTEDVAPGQPGEIVINGPHIMKGYWKNPEETADQIRDGWLHTGDIATQDDDGYLFIVDRKKDMIIAGGYNIYPREIDEVLFRHPKVKEAVAVGVPDAYRGETVKAFVVLKDGMTATDQEIIGFCKQSLAAYKAPKLVEFMDTLPKSAVGKILRKVLLEQEMAGLRESD